MKSLCCGTQARRPTLRSDEAVAVAKSSCWRPRHGHWPNCRTIGCVGLTAQCDARPHAMTAISRLHRHCQSPARTARQRTRPALGGSALSDRSTLSAHVASPIACRARKVEDVYKLRNGFVRRWVGTGKKVPAAARPNTHALELSHIAAVGAERT
jgi:hypothetical protein